MFPRMTVLVIVWTLLSGCQAFGVKPVPERLSEDEQARYVYGWEHLVALGADATHTELMDTLLFTQAWHRGVDHLYLRSEKQVGDLLVVMESHFDRTHPDDDAFTVTFYDAQNQVSRREVFATAEMDAALDLMYTNDDEQMLDNETPEEYEQRRLRLAERNARLQRVAEVFPAPPDPNESAEP